MLTPETTRPSLKPLPKSSARSPSAGAALHDPMLGPWLTGLTSPRLFLLLFRIDHDGHALPLIPLNKLAVLFDEQGDPRPADLVSPTPGNGLPFQHNLFVGVFNIPLMKKTGYAAEFAAGVEAATYHPFGSFH